MNKSNLKTNFSFQTLYQIVSLVLPFFVAPIVTRACAQTDLGAYNWAASIAYLFIIGCNLGVSTHGQRLIANDGDDLEKVREDFTSLFINHFFTSIIGAAAFLICVFLFWNGEYGFIFFLQCAYVLSALFDVTWLFYGLQNVKPVVIAHFFIGAVSSLMTIFLVQTQNGFLWYVIINSSRILVANIIVFLLAIVKIRFRKIPFKRIRQDWKPLLLFTLVIVASTLYTSFDKTILGIACPSEEVAFYNYADKLITIPKSLIATIGLVLFPKICNLIAKGEKEETQKIRTLSFEVVFFFCIGSAFGLAAISNRLAVAYYGDGYERCGEYLQLMCPLIFIILVGDIFRQQYLVPEKKDFPYVLSICVAAVVNLILSFALVYVIGGFGVIVGSLVAEFIATVIQGAYCRKEVPWRTLLFPFVYFCLAGVTMFLGLRVLSKLISNGIVFVVVAIFVGFAFFGGLGLVFFFGLSKNKSEYKKMIRKGQKNASHG